MRLTNVVLDKFNKFNKSKPGHNLYRHFKYQWYLKRHRPLVETKEREILEQKFGVIVQQPDEVLSKAYDTPR